MKTKYPEYKVYRDKLSDLQAIESKLSKKNKDILDKYCEFCRATAGEQKVKKVRSFMLQIYDVTERDFDKQNKETIASFIATLNHSNRSTPTKNEIKSYLKKFIKWFYRNLSQQEIEDMTCLLKKETFEVNPRKVNENNLITEQDIEKMLRSADNFKDKAILFLLFESGGRPQEIVTLRWRDIKFEEGYANITFYSGKTGQSRTFPVRKAREFLWQWKENYSFPNLKLMDYVFPSRFNSEEPVTTSSINKMLRILAKRAKIGKDIWNYLFRHSRATRLYEELPTPIVEQLLGHKDMYRTYAHISTKKAREELLDKIYNVKEMPEEQREEFKKKLDELTKKQELLEADLERRKSLDPMLNELFSDPDFKKLLLKKKKLEVLGK